MRRKELLDWLDERVAVADGAMGTQIYDAGVPFDHCFDALNLEDPSLVERIHRAYIEAGADWITTNTFGSNRVRLAEWGIDDQVDRIAEAGARLARRVADAANRRVLVAGSVGPLGKPLAPIGRIDPVQAREFFRETASALVQGGVDLIVVETFIDLREAVEAVRAVREVAPDLAVVAHASFSDEGKTVIGHKPAEVARELLAAGADVVGANCSAGVAALEEVIDRMAGATEAPLSVVPNAGLPQMVGGRLMYLASPDYMADRLAELVARGVRVVGGCCGTGPRHIAVLRERIEARGLHGRRPRRRRAAAPAPVEMEAPTEQPPEPAPEDEPRALRFRDKLAAGQFVVSVEIDPPRGVDAEPLIAGAQLCKANGIDAINIADSPLARARMSPLALSVLIRQHVDIDIVLHMSCRDRNLLGLQAECMGAHALGIRNILCITGDPPQVGDYPDATGVFDVDSIGLVTLLTQLNAGVDLAGKPLKYSTDFFLGVASNPTAVDLDVELDRWRRKVEAGCHFTMTQPLYDLDVLERWLELANPTVPVLVGILPLRNARHARFLHNEVPGMYVPQSIQERMERAGADGPREGVRIAQEFLERAARLVQGAYLMPPFGRYEMAVEVCEVLR